MIRSPDFWCPILVGAIGFQQIFRCYIRYGYLYGHVTVPADLTGVVVSIPPGQYAFTLRRLVRIGFLHLPLEFGVSLTHRVWTILNCFERHHRTDVPPCHIYLLAIGVDPPHQCKGIGSALIRTVLDEADRDGHPCYLESTSERNMAFYERHGFRVVRRGDIPRGGPPYWTMLRGPTGLNAETNARFLLVHGREVHDHRSVLESALNSIARRPPLKHLRERLFFLSAYAEKRYSQIHDQRR
ncbi:MAG: GNAT family N-acetyltransferase [Syntrophobacteraceae bacterium]|nr:GNAT family N-acetyltransferase [Syntrophobacteraceae bacterium]